MNAAPGRTDQRTYGARIAVNWVLALLTVPAAGLAYLFALGAVMSTDRCASEPCAHLGPGPFWFGVLHYGPAVVAILTIAVSFYSATRRRGWIVPTCALALIAIDVAVLAYTFRP